jgi:hypothetical protein
MLTPLPTHQLTSWRWKPSNLIFALENNIKDVVNVTTFKMMLEQNNKVTNIWKVQFNPKKLYLFELFALQNN